MNIWEFLVKFRWIILVVLILVMFLVGVRHCSNFGGCNPDSDSTTPKPVTSDQPVANVTAPPRSIGEILTGQPNKELRNVPEPVRRRGVSRVVRVVPKVSDEVVEEIVHTAVETTKTEVVDAVVDVITDTVENDGKDSYTDSEVIELVDRLVEETVATLDVPVDTDTVHADPIDIVETRDGEVFISDDSVSSAVVINFPDQVGFCWKWKVGVAASFAHRPETYYTLPVAGGEFAYWNIYDQEGQNVRVRLTLDVLLNWEAGGLGASVRPGKWDFGLVAGVMTPYRNIMQPGPYVGLTYTF